VITRTDIEVAADRTGDRVRVTPVLALGPDLVLKLELAQHTGSFKPRGAFNRILAAGTGDGGVIAASGGNHGLAVAYAARALGRPAEVFLPETSSPVKVARLRGYGATVRLVGRHYAEALAASEARAAETGALVVHAYDQPEVQAGQGTLARELDRQVSDVDTVLVAVGGGGLIAGVATWYAGRARIVAVEPERIPTLASALTAGRPVDVEVSGVALDSLGARRISADSLAVCQHAGVRSVLVSDDDIVAARRALWNEARIAAEHGGAAALAALWSGAYRPEPGERVAVVVCGGNTDPSDLA